MLPGSWGNRQAAWIVGVADGVLAQGRQRRTQVQEIPGSADQATGGGGAGCLLCAGHSSLFILCSTHSIVLSLIHSFMHQMYGVCPESIQPHTMKNRDIYWRRYNIQETLCRGCLSPLRSYDFLEEIWFIGVKSLATAALCSFSSSSRSHGMNFAMTYFMPRSYMKTSDTVAFAIPRSASSSHTVRRQSLLIAARTRSTFSGVLLVAGLPEHG